METEQIQTNFTKDQQYVYNKLMNTKDSIFLTGDAGTGKSFVINNYRHRTYENVIVAAPTGTAAVDVGGTTLHSLFKLPPDDLFFEKETDILKYYKSDDSDLVELINTVDVLIIDEISMVRSDLMNLIDKLCRLYRGNQQFMGGIRLVVVGDLSQLCPVTSDFALKVLENDKNSELIQELTKASYIYNRTIKGAKVKFINVKKYLIDHFNSIYFTGLEDVAKNLIVANLTEVVRQSDPFFKNLLRNLRYNINIPYVINELNKRVKPISDVSELDENTIVLCSTNNSVNYFNNKALSSLNTPSFKFDAIYDKKSDITKTDFPVDQSITLKVGAKVMIRMNDSKGRFSNGSLGVILYIRDAWNSGSTVVGVKLLSNGLVVDIKRNTFNITKYTTSNGRITTYTVDYNQIPLSIAYAMTVHKSQGKTFDAIHFVPADNFSPSGLAYTVFSRCRTLEGITIQRPLKQSDFNMDPEVLSLYRRLLNNERL